MVPIFTFGCVVSALSAYIQQDQWFAERWPRCETLFQDCEGDILSQRALPGIGNISKAKFPVMPVCYTRSLLRKSKSIIPPYYSPGPPSVQSAADSAVSDHLGLHVHHRKHDRNLHVQNSVRVLLPLMVVIPTDDGMC